MRKYHSYYSEKDFSIKGVHQKPWLSNSCTNFELLVNHAKKEKKALESQTMAFRSSPLRQQTSPFSFYPFLYLPWTKSRHSLITNRKKENQTSPPKAFCFPLFMLKLSAFSQFFEPLFFSPAAPF